MRSGAFHVEEIKEAILIKMQALFIPNLIYKKLQLPSGFSNAGLLPGIRQDIYVI